jgi:hypothetical protein
MALAFFVAISGPKKDLFVRALPLMTFVMDVARIKIIMFRAIITTGTLKVYFSHLNWEA